MNATVSRIGRDHGDVDVAVIGGGINGAGIARDAAGRGLKVLLCEKDDFAEGTSSRSGKLIHGGLRYLEFLELRLVRESLREREVLLRAHQMSRDDQALVHTMLAALKSAVPAEP